MYFQRKMARLFVLFILLFSDNEVVSVMQMPEENEPSKEDSTLSTPSSSSSDDFLVSPEEEKKIKSLLDIQGMLTCTIDFQHLKRKIQVSISVLMNRNNSLTSEISCFGSHRFVTQSVIIKIRINLHHLAQHYQSIFPFLEI